MEEMKEMSWGGRRSLVMERIIIMEVAKEAYAANREDADGGMSLKLNMGRAN